MLPTQQEQAFRNSDVGTKHSEIQMVTIGKQTFSGNRILRARWRQDTTAWRRRSQRRRQDAAARRPTGGVGMEREPS